MALDVILAMFIKMWLRELGRELRQHTVADPRAMGQERRIQSLRRWKLDKALPFLALLLITSLVFFCCGIIVYISTIWIPGAIAYSIVVGIATTAYLFTVFVPIFDKYAPFPPGASSLFTGVWQRFWRVWLPSPAGTSFLVSHFTPPFLFRFRSTSQTQILPNPLHHHSLKAIECLLLHSPKLMRVPE